MIYLSTAILLTPGGSSTVHIYTQTIRITTQIQKMHRTTQIQAIYVEQHKYKQSIEQHKYKQYM